MNVHENRQNSAFGHTDTRSGSKPERNSRIFILIATILKEGEFFWYDSGGHPLGYARVS